MFFDTSKFITLSRMAFGKMNYLVRDSSRWGKQLGGESSNKWWKRDKLKGKPVPLGWGKRFGGSIVWPSLKPKLGDAKLNFP